MSFDLPKKLEKDVERYARAEHMSAKEAVVKLVQEALDTKGHPSQISDSEWEKLREFDPGIDFFRSLPEAVLDSIEAASKEARSDRLRSRA